jgi:hypothetical protein
MSKIYVLALALLMLCGVESFAKRQVDLSTQFVDPTPTMKVVWQIILQRVYI